MTGYGRAQGLVASRQVTVEVRCYNHRFTDVRVRLPRGWTGLEVPVESLIRGWVGRGRVECSVASASGAPNVGIPTLDMDCAREYLHLFRELAREMWKETGTEELPRLDLIAASEGVMVFGEVLSDIDAAWSELGTLLEKALQAAGRMREVEGRKLSEELDKRFGEAKRVLENIRSVVPKEQEVLREKASERIRALAGEVEVSEERLIQEMAVLAERMDVTEELARLEGHLGQFRSLMERQDPVGRELDFVLQEVNREINTLASKLHSVAVVNLAVSLKAEAEKMREQVQNVE